MPTPVPPLTQSTTPDCNFALVVPTTLGNLSEIADAILKSTQLSAKLLSPLPTAVSPSRRGASPFPTASSELANSTGNLSLLVSSLENFDLFGVPFSNSGHTWLHIIITIIIVVAMMIVIIFGNALVIIAVRVDKSLKGIQNYFIISLAVADLLVGLTIMPLSLAVELMGKWIFGQIMCNLWLGGDVLLCTASILNLCMISIDRYWSVTLAGQYTARLRKRRVTTLIVLVWILSGVISLPPLVGWARKYTGDDECELMDDLWYIAFSTCVSFYAPLVVMIVVYMRIFVIARRTARKSAFKLTKQLQKRNATPHHHPATNTAQLQGGLGALKAAESPDGLVFNNLNNGINSSSDNKASSVNTMSTRTADGSSLLRQLSKENGDNVVTPTVTTDMSFDYENNGLGDETTRQLAVFAADTGVVCSQVGNNNKFQQRESRHSVVSTNKFQRSWRQVLLSKYFHRRNNRSFSLSISSNDSSDDLALSMLRRQSHILESQGLMPIPYAANNAQARNISPIGEDDEMSVRSCQSAANRHSPASHLSNDSAIHLASALLGNVAMSLAVIPTNRAVKSSATPPSLNSPAGRLKMNKNDSLTHILQSLSQQTPDTTETGVASAKHSPKAQPLSKTMSAQPRTNSPTIPMDDVPRRSSQTHLSSPETPEKVIVENGAESVTVGVTFSPRSKKPAAAGPTISLAEEVERRKKRLAKERERRTTRILVIIMLSFVGCWFPFFTLYLVSALVGFHVNRFVFATFFWLGYFNSALNPVSYAAFNKDFRGAFKRILKIK